MAIGYWSTHTDVVHLNEFISFGKVNEKTDLYFFIVRSDIKNKFFITIIYLKVLLKVNM